MIVATPPLRCNMTAVRAFGSINILANIDITVRMLWPGAKKPGVESTLIEGSVSMQRGKILAGVAMAAAIAVSGPAGAVDLKSLVGTWKWTDFTTQSKECTTNPAGAGLCMTVIAGPKNIGMEMIRSKFEDRGADGFVGKIAHPASGEIYNTRMTLKGEVWHMDGCTDAGVCATGDFIRQK